MKIFRKGFFLSANCKKDRSSKKISVFSFTHFPSSHSKNMAYLYRASQDGEWKGERVVQTLISLWGPTGASCQVACLILSSSKTRPCLWRFHMHSFVRSPHTSQASHWARLAPNAERSHPEMFYWRQKEQLVRKMLPIYLIIDQLLPVSPHPPFFFFSFWVEAFWFYLYKRTTSE